MKKFLCFLLISCVLFFIVMGCGKKADPVPPQSLESFSFFLN
ncbi:hypothetical protein GMMP15_1490008 [Candidatus Magnetomoraceae bacterium gMMP-15]